MDWLRQIKKNLFLKLILLLVLALPFFLIFKRIFLPGILTGGDIPFFYPKGLKELVAEPLAWSDRGVNFGGINLLIWISPLTILYGVLGFLLRLGNDLTIRLIFYFPAIIISFVGPLLFGKYLNLSKISRILFAGFYTLNTYFILLVDGGQVGVALAYGLFPLSLFFVKKYIDRPGVKNFYVALISLIICGIADPRVCIIVFITMFFWLVVERKFRKIKYLLLLVPCWVLVNLYWIYPLLKSSGPNLSLGNINLPPMSLVNSLAIFQPHWPGNEFGKVTSPSFYFMLLPISLISSFFIIKKGKHYVYALLFLIFAFLTKGPAVPFGQIYTWILGLPFGFAFRDSSKFFIPTIFFAGMLIGEINEKLFNKFSKTSMRFLLPFFVYLYIILTLHQAILGNLNFVLSSGKNTDDLQKISTNLEKDSSYYRTAWFTEVPTLAPQTINNPALSAKDLVSVRPLAQLNEGEDVFNYINNPNYLSWFRVMGIKYLVLSGNPRNIHPSDKDIESWNNTQSLINKTNGLTSLQWASNFPVYELQNTYPKLYKADRLIAVVGPEASSSASLVPSIYFEDGKWDPSILSGKNKDSIKIYFNGKDQSDLVMSFLQKNFMTLSNNKTSQWAYFSTEKYLNAKYELLIRGIEYKDFDYNRGFAMSTQANEEIQVSTTLDAGNYMLAIRSFSGNDGDTLSIFINGKENTYKPKLHSFGWNIFGPFNFDKSEQTIKIKNNGGLQVVNTLALVAEKDYKDAQKEAQDFVSYFGTTEKIGEFQPKEVPFDEVSTLKYKFTSPDSGYWVILSENYNPLWQLRRGISYFSSVPVYSMFNGFYVEPKRNDVALEFKGQDDFRWGLYYSLLSVALLSLVYFWYHGE